MPELKLGPTYDTSIVLAYAGPGFSLGVYHFDPVDADVPGEARPRPTTSRTKA
jgi:hypothetical protein